MLLGGWLVAVVVFGSAIADHMQFLQYPYNIYLPEVAHDLQSEDVPVIVKHLMGLSAKKPSSWHARGDALDRPEAVLVLNVRGTPKWLTDVLRFEKQVDQDKHAPQYELDGALSDDDAFHSLATDIELKFGEYSTVIRMTKTSIQTFGADRLPWDAKVDGVNTKLTKLREELSNLKRIQKFLDENGGELRNSSPDLFVLEISGLEDKQTQKEDVEELRNMILELSRSLMRTYGGDDCVIELITGGNEPIGHVRRKREIVKRQANAQSQTTTDYDFADEDTPAIFAIILFTSLGLALVVFFVTISFWFMDPGKDTIIYRMTMTRAKKD